MPMILNCTSHWTKTNPLKDCKIALTLFILGSPRTDCRLIRRSRKQSFSEPVRGWGVRTGSHPCRSLRQLSAHEQAWIVSVWRSSGLTFNEHVDNICKASAYHIRSLRHIWRFIDEDASTSVATALVSARIDYCNSLLYDTSKSNIDKLQRLQNSLARAVMCTAKFDSITPVLAALHWLPIKARITFKVALLTRKVLTTQQPGYLSSLIRVNQPTRQLRPSTHRVLCSTAPRTAFASRAFCHAAPAVWNKLPNCSNVVRSTVSLSEFKRNLKSFLYKHSFPVWSRDWSAHAIFL